jgi:multiple sugar transport system substrate-binding protein
MMLSLKLKLFLIPFVVLSLFFFLMPTAALSEEVTLKVLSTEGDPDSITQAKAIIAEYEQTHPNVKIEYENIPYEKLIERTIAAAIAGESLGIQLTWAEISYELGARGLMEPLDDVIDAIGRDDFVKPSLLSYEGKIYMVPYFMTGYVMYYREDILKKNGQQPPKTWDELLKVAEACTEDLDGDGKVDRYGIVFPAGKNYGTTTFFLQFAYQKGGSILDPEGNVAWNSKPIKETFEYFRKLKQFAPPGISEYGWGEQISLYYTEAVAMSMYPGRLLGRTKRHNPDILPVTKAITYPTPTGDPSEKQAISEVAGISIMKGTKNLDVAKDFVKFFLTGDRYIKWCNTVPGHFIPSRISARNDPAYWSDPLLNQKKDVVDIIIKASETGRHPLYEWEGKVNVNANRLYTSYILSDCIQEIIIKDSDIDKTLDKYEKKIKRELKKMKRK